MIEPVAQNPVQQSASAPKSEKFGDVKKCPACAAIAQSFQTNCSDCGHEFSNIIANVSIGKLFEMLNACENERKEGGLSLAGAVGGLFAKAYGLGGGDKILEIGTGSGFQTCILCQMGAKVFSIERQRELHLKARKIIHELNFTPRLSFGDGYLGLPLIAPFDKIIVTCGAPDIPQTLKDQLKIGGVMIIPIGEGSEQIMKRIVKISETEFQEEELGTFKFVPMLERKVK